MSSESPSPEKRIGGEPGSSPQVGSAGNSLLLWQRRLSIVVLTLLSVFLLFQLGSYFADIIRILGISILLSYLFINVTDWLEKVLTSRAMAILVVYLLIGIATVIGAILVVPAMIYQVTQLVETIFNHIPEVLEYLQHAITPLEERLHAAKIDVKAIDILQSFVSNIPRPEPTLVFNRMSDMAMSTMTWLLYGLSIMVVSFYFLLDGRRMKDAVISLCPARHHTRLQMMASQIDTSLQGFFRGQIVLGLVFGAVMWLVYLALGVPYALLLGVLLGIWEVVPVIGPPIGFLPAFIAVAIHGMANVPVNRIWQLIILVLVFNGLQWLKDNLVAPRYIGNVIGLHPVTIFVAIMIGAKLDGMLGIIFALPAACVANVIFTNLHESELHSERAARADSNNGQSIAGQSASFPAQKAQSEAGQSAPSASPSAPVPSIAELTVQPVHASEAASGTLECGLVPESSQIGTFSSPEPAATNPEPAQSDTKQQASAQSATKPQEQELA